MQKIVNGITALPNILKDLGCRKVFLVIDASYPYLNIKADIEALNEKIEMVRFSDFTPNPLYEQVCVGLALINDCQCDAIMAVGGGSAIDVAKCIKLAMLAEEGASALIPPLVSKRLPIDGTKVPFIAIPTTAGTGSESTHNAVMYYEGVKQTVTNDGILPDLAILEPSVLNTLPLYQKKCTMMDAFCQGIESWWSVNSTPESREYSQKTVELVMKHWHDYIFKNDPKAAQQIMLAANYSGRAINIAQTTAAHAMSYKITSLFKLPHGHAVAICLPEIWDYMLGHPIPVFNNIAKAMGVGTPKEAIGLFRSMMSELQLEHPTANEDRDNMLHILCESVNPIRLKNNPVTLQPEVIMALYQRIVRALNKLP